MVVVPGTQQEESSKDGDEEEMTMEMKRRIWWHTSHFTTTTTTVAAEKHIIMECIEKENTFEKIFENNSLKRDFLKVQTVLFASFFHDNFSALLEFKQMKCQMTRNLCMCGFRRSVVSERKEKKVREEKRKLNK